MKKISYIILSLIFIGCEEQRKDFQFQIDISDHKFSMANTFCYHMNNNEIYIVQKGGLEGEIPDTIFKRNLTLKEVRDIKDFLYRFPIDSLKDEYIDLLMDDGNVKNIRIVIDNKEKTIFLSNSYQNDIASLLSLINKIIDNKEYSIYLMEDN